MFMLLVVTWIISPDHWRITNWILDRAANWRYDDREKCLAADRAFGDIG